MPTPELPPIPPPPADSRLRSGPQELVLSNSAERIALVGMGIGWGVFILVSTALSLVGLEWHIRQGSVGTSVFLVAGILFELGVVGLTVVWPVVHLRKLRARYARASRSVGVTPFGHERLLVKGSKVIIQNGWEVAEVDPCGAAAERCGPPNSAAWRFRFQVGLPYPISVFSSLDYDDADYVERTLTSLGFVVTTRT